MKLKTKLMMFTAAAALSANMAFAASINPQTLADAYIREGYSYVEVKVGPTQTKLEAVKGDRKVEVIYDTATGKVLKEEFDDADDDYLGKTGVEIEDEGEDFIDGDDAEDDDAEDDDAEDDDDTEDDDENDDDDAEDDDGNDDSDGGDDDSDGGDDDSDEGDDDSDEGDDDDSSDGDDDSDEGDGEDD